MNASIAEIDAMGLEELRSFWARHYGAPLALRSVPILKMLIAWRIQAAAFGGLDLEARKSLRRKGQAKAEGLNLGIGAKVTRTWQGRRVEVIVDADGFRWEGKHYKSLSAVASAIAGSRWNGPRFFGLRDQ